MAGPFDLESNLDNPFVSKGMKRRAAAQVAYDTAPKPGVVDPYEGNWAAETGRSILGGIPNDLNLVKSLGQGLIGDEEGSRASAQQYLAREEELNSLGPEIQSFDDAKAAGGGVGDYGAALAFQGAELLPDLAMALTGAGVGAGVARGAARRAVRSGIERDLTEFAAQRGVGEAARDAARRETIRETLVRQGADTKFVAGQLRVARAQADEGLARTIRRQATELTGRTPRDADFISRMTKYGARAGGAAGAVPGINSGNAEMLARDDATQGDAAKLAVGVGLGAATSLVPLERLLRGFGDDAVEAVRKKGMKMLPRMAKEFAEQGITEGSQEAVQQAIQLASHKAIDQNIDLLSPEAMDQYIASFGAGFLAGGALGAGGEGGRAAARATGDAAAAVGRGAKAVYADGREKVKAALSAAADRRRDARAKQGQPMGGDAPAAADGASTPAELYRRAKGAAGAVGDAVAAVGGRVMDRFNSMRDDIDTADALEERTNAVYQAWEQGGAPMILGERRPANLNPIDVKGLQGHLLSYVNPDSPIWGSSPALKQAGDALEKLFTSDKGKGITAADERVYDALVSEGSIEQITLDSMRALGPEWAERARQAAAYDPDADDDQDADDANVIEAAGGELNAMQLAMQRAREQQTAAEGAPAPAADVPGADVDVEGDVTNNALTNGEGRLGGAPLRPAERLANLTLNGGSDEDIEIARADLRRDIFKGEGTESGGNIQVQVAGTADGRQRWAKVEREINSSPNRIEIAPVDVGRNRPIIARRALSLDSLVTAYVNQIDDFDTSTEAGQQQRAKAALYQAFADIKSAGIPIKPSTITAGWLGDKGRAKNGTYIGRLLPKDVAELRAMYGDKREVGDPGKARDAQRARDAAVKPRKKVPAPRTGEARQKRLDNQFAVDTARGEKEDLVVDADDITDDNWAAVDALKAAMGGAEAQGENEIDGMNADVMRLKDPSLVQMAPMKRAAPGAKITEGDRNPKEDPEKPGKNAPLRTDYTPTQGVSDVTGADPLGDIARKARAEAKQMGLVDPNAGVTYYDGSGKQRTVRPTERKQVNPKADPRFVAGLNIGLQRLQAERDTGALNERRFNVQVQRLQNPESGLAVKYYNDAYSGKFVTAKVVEQKTDRVDVDNAALEQEQEDFDLDERTGARETATPKGATEKPITSIPRDVLAARVKQNSTKKAKRKRAATAESLKRKSQAAANAGVTSMKDDLESSISTTSDKHDIAREQKMLDAMIKQMGLAEGVTLKGDSKINGGRYAKRPDGSLEIHISEQLEGAERVEVMMHELGHHIVYSELAKLAGVRVADLSFGYDPKSTRERFAILKKGNPELYKALVDDYAKWKDANPRSQDRRATRAGRAPYNRALTALSSFKGGSADTMSSDDSRYLYSFDEYLADSIARALTTQAKPVSMIEKFFDSIAKALRQMWDSFTPSERKVWGAPPSVDAWVRQLFSGDAAAVAHATGAHVPAASVEPAVTAAVTDAAAPLDFANPEALMRRLPEVAEFMRTTLPREERLILESVLSRPESEAALRAHFKGFEDLLDDAKDGMQFKLAMGYIAWREGGLTRTGPRARMVFQDVRDSLGVLAGVSLEGDLAQRVLEDIANGTVDHYRAKGKTYSVRELEGRARGGLQQAVNWLAAEGPISNALASFWTGTYQRMKDTGLPAMRELAAVLQRPQGTTSDDDDRGLIPAVRQKQYEFHRKFASALEGLTEGEQVRVIQAMQRQAKPGTPAYENRSPKLKASIAALRKVMNEAHAYMLEAGIPVGKRESFFPVTMDIRDPATRDGLTKFYSQPKFRAAVLNAANVRPDKNEDEDATFQRALKLIVDAAANDDQLVDPVSVNGQPGFRHKNKRMSAFVYDLSTYDTDGELIERDPRTAAEREADIAKFSTFQTKNVDEIFARYFGPMVKYVEFQRRLGGQDSKTMRRNRDGLDRLLERVREEGGTDDDVKLAEDAVRAALGTYGVESSPILNKISPALAKKFSGPKTKAFVQGAQAYQNLRLLPLALLSSLVDPMGIAVRSGGSFGETWTGLRAGMKSLGNKEARADALRLLESIGQADDFLPAIASHPVFEGSESPVARRINNFVFKYNGMQTWVQATRVMAAHAGQQFLLKHAASDSDTSKRYLAELSITPADIKADPDNPDRVVMNDKTRAVLSQFVDEAILRPNALQAPLWHRDPYFGLVTQYKSFAYAIYDQITGRFTREISQGNYRVILAALMYLPIVMMAELLRELIQHGGSGNPQRKEWGADDYTLHAATKTGLLGPRAEIIGDVSEDVKRDRVVGSSQLGPTATQAKGTLGALSGDRDLSKEVEAALPASAAWKRWNDEPAMET